MTSVCITGGSRSVCTAEDVVLMGLGLVGVVGAGAMLIGVGAGGGDAAGVSFAGSASVFAGALSDEVESRVSFTVWAGSSCALDVDMHGTSFAISDFHADFLRGACRDGDTVWLVGEDVAVWASDVANFAGCCAPFEDAPGSREA